MATARRGDQRGQKWRETVCSKERDRAEVVGSVCEREKRRPVEPRARYAIWRYRGQRLVRNTKLFMNGRKLSLKL